MTRPALLVALCCPMIYPAGAQEVAPQEPLTRFGVTVVRSSGLRGEVFAIPPRTERLPKFSRLKPFTTLYTTTLDVPPIESTKGFPGIAGRTEWFAIDYKGRFWIARAGEYEFSLASDDGSKLYIDGRVVIRNDGIHPCLTRVRKVALAAGAHAIRVAYFQGPGGGLALVVKIAPPGEPWRIFDTDEFGPPAASDK